MVDSEGSMECTWFSYAGGLGLRMALNRPRWKVRIRKGSAQVDKGMQPICPWTKVVVDEDGAAGVDVTAWWIGECTVLDGVGEIG